MAGVAVVAIHQSCPSQPGWQGGAWAWQAGKIFDPFVQRPHVDVGAAGQEARLVLNPFLPVQKHLVVFEHGVVTDVLQPHRPSPQQQPGQQRAELKREAGKQAAFPSPDRRCIHNREEAGKSLRREVVPHQARRLKGGELAAQAPPARALGPRSSEPLRPETGQLSYHWSGVLALTHRAVVGEGHMAHIEHVLQQGEGIHRQVAEGVLHQPAGFLKHGHQRQGHGRSRGRVAGKNKQQPLGAGCGVAAAGAAGVGAACGFGLGDRRAAALGVETPTVIRALQLTPLVEAAFAQGHEPVGADVGKGAPLLACSVPPQHQIHLQQGEGRGAARVEILQIGHRIPTLQPVLIPDAGAAGGIHNRSWDQHGQRQQLRRTYGWMMAR